MRPLILKSLFVALFLLASFCMYGQISATWTVKNLDCYQDTSGAIYLTATGGTPPYTYDWTPPAVGPQTLPDNDTITDLWAGNYSVTIYDNIGASQTYNNIAVTQRQAPSFNLGFTCNPVCLEAEVLRSEGGDTIFLWDDASTAPTNCNIVTNSLYSVTMTDGYGCTVENSISTAGRSLVPLTTDTTMTTVYCNNMGGEAEILPSGGVPPYTHLWEYFGILGYGSWMGELSAQTPYVVTTTDAVGCSVVDTVELPTEPHNDYWVDVLDVDYCDGLVCLGFFYVPQDTPAYVWNTGDEGPSMCSPISGGNNYFEVNVYDNYRCWYREVINVNMPENRLSTSIVAYPPVCGIYDSIKVNVFNGGIPPYSFIWSTGDTTQSINNPSPGFYSVTVSDANGGCSSIESITVYDGDTSDFDLYSYGVMSSTFRPGIPVVVDVHGANNTCLATSGTLYLIYDTSIFTFNSAIYTPDIMSGDTLGWHFTNLQLAIKKIIRQVNFSTSTQVPLGTTAIFQTLIMPVNGDIQPSNNLRFYVLEARNSYDPNDKQTYPMRCAPNNYVLADERLTYTIRFQNTGNAEAYRIYILDTLDSNLEWDSINVLASSHGAVMQTQLLQDSILKFNFTDIFLPDSASDPEGSQGYVVFDILPKANTPNGTVIENKVGIYFDFNDPVITNTVHNTIVDSVPVYRSSLTVTQCGSYTYNSTVIDQSGIYNFPFLASDGCDSVVTLNVTIEDTIQVSFTETICAGESYEGYTTTGIYTDVFTATNGCDSARILHLTVDEAFQTSVNPTICWGDSYNGYTTTGTYVDTLTSVTGCDSIITTNLVVNHASSVTFNDTACNSYTSPSGNNTWTDSGTYTDTLLNASGCDSLITVNLTILPFSTNNLLKDEYLGCGLGCDWLTANVQGNVAYLWSTGATNRQIQVCPPVSSTYHLTVTDNATGCEVMASAEVTVSDTTCGPGLVRVCKRRNRSSLIEDCVDSSLVVGLLAQGATLGCCTNSSGISYGPPPGIRPGNISYRSLQSFTSPNPFSRKTTIVFNSPQPAYIQVEIYNAIGQRVAYPFSAEIEENKVYQAEFIRGKLPKGIYIAKVTSNKGEVNYHKLFIID